MAGGPAARGFTLLEMIVVLVLLASIAAVAAPNLGRLHEGLAGKTERDRILERFAGLGLLALRQGRPCVVSAAGGESPGPWDAAARPPAHGADACALDLPEGWEARLDRPLVVRANGVCLGARLTLLRRGVVDARLDLEPPYCRVEAGA